MKSNTRTVLDATLTGITSYSSGALFVGDLYELAIDIDITAASGSGTYTWNVSRIGADSSVNLMQSFGPYGNLQSTHGNFGAGLSQDFSFGDQVQIDLVDSGFTLTGTISILGK